MIEMKLDSLEGISKEIAKLYVEKDGAYVLNVSTDDKGEKDKGNQNAISKNRLDAEISKRREAEMELQEIADELKKDVPEEFTDLMPDIPPRKLIPWLRNAFAKGLFDPKQFKESLDSKRPSDKKPKSLDGLSPQQRIVQGYKKLRSK